MTEVIKVNQTPIPPEQLLSHLKQYQMLPQLLRELVIDRAIAQIECSGEEVETAKQEFVSQNRLNDPNRLQAWLNHTGLKQEDLETLAVRSYKIKKFKQETWGSKIESYFLQRKRDLDQVVYSLLRTKDQNTATELYFRLQNQEASFEALAQAYSQGPEAETRGIVGPVPVTTPHEKIAKMLMQSEPSQLWPPVRIGEWSIIVRLEKLISAQLNDATRQKLLNELFSKWLEEEVKKMTTIEPLNSETSEVAS
ncbi:PpiC-type peptidyl-prolyl cis-trans isomerase [Halothece sp. PCC 7418]|uniref:peptidylprolyl isomerase n=1 Tax=Halothece sp. (strain PCC 7418) TaxID=65093 RepID=UPI0002A08CDB|nr:peptidylprolyl isomerase [Halothece sp. PCC 7418]AFZ44953.1 PpiC-type peptidyl-prolyl cis-trans isomerase [Halothece sp. PCC 7418]